MAINAADLLVNVRADVDDARRKIKAVDDDLDKLGGTFDFTGKAARSFGIAAAAGFAALATQAAVGPIAAFVGALVPIGGLLAAIPGVVAAAGAAFATLKLGLYGVGDAFKALASGDAEKFAEALKKLAPNAQAFFRALQTAGPAFSALRLDVQNALFQGLGFHVDRLARTYIPALKPGMVAIASGFNAAARAVADFLARADVVMDVKSIFDNTGKATQSLKNIFPDLTAAFLDFASVGAALMPEFLTYLEGGAERFRAWADEARKSGQIEEWIRNGATAARDFGGVLLNVGQIIGTIGKAANEAFGGGGFLANMKANTQAVEDFLKSAQGQDALVTFFQSTKAAMEAVGPVLRELFLAFTTGLVPVLSNLAVGIGPGLAIFLTGLKDALIAIQPGALLVGQAIGSILTAIGPLLPPLGEFINAMVVRLAPFLPEIILGVVGLMAAFKGASAITGAAQAISLFLNPVGLAVLAAAALAAGLVIAYRESETFRDIVNGVWENVQKYAAEFITYFQSDLWPRVKQVWEDIKSAFTGGEVTAGETMGRFKTMLAAVAEFVRTWAEAVKTAFKVAVAVITFLWDTFGKTLVEGIQAALTAVMTIAEGVLNMLSGALKVFSGLFTGNWSKMWDGIKQIFSGAGTALTGIIDLFLSRLMMILGLAANAIGVLFKGLWAAAKAIFNAGVGLVVDIVTGLPGAALRALNPLTPGLTATASAAWKAFQDKASDLIADAVADVKALPGRFKTALGNLSTLLSSAGADLIRGLANGIGDAAGQVVAKAVQVANSVKDAVKGALGISSPSKVMMEIGQWTGEGLANGIADMERMVAAAGSRLAQAAVPDVSRGTGLAPTPAALTGAQGGTTGASVSVAAGAVQVVIQGDVTEKTLPQVQSSVDDAFRALLAEINGGRVPGRVA